MVSISRRGAEANHWNRVLCAPRASVGLQIVFARLAQRNILRLKGASAGFGCSTGPDPGAPHMANWKPDPSFYPSPRMAAKAAPETVAYVAAFDPDRKTPDPIPVVDVDPQPNSYSNIPNTTPLPHAS